jgi:hypothetical protein
MKILPSHLIMRRHQDGSAVFVLIVLLSIMVILSAVNSKALFILHREIKLLDQQQVKRLIASQTNTVASTPITALPDLK